jgi:hypothetical protein
MKIEIINGIGAFIWLEEYEVDYTRIKSKALAEGFREQTKRHITIIGGMVEKLIDEILIKYNEKEKENIKKEIKNLLESFEWKYKQKDIYFIEKEGYIDNRDIKEKRQSYIAIVDMPDMEIFYKKLNALLNSNLPIQMPHITLFTKGERENPIFYGIPIPSEEEFQKLNPQKIINPL